MESVIDLSLSAAAAWGLDGFANPGGFRWRFSYRVRSFISGGGDLDRERSGQRFHSVWIQLNYHILVDLPGDLDQNNIGFGRI